MGDGREPNEHISAAMRTLERAQQLVSVRFDAFNDATDSALGAISSLLFRTAPQVMRHADELTWFVSEAIDSATEAASAAIMRAYSRLQGTLGTQQTMWLPYRRSWLFSSQLMAGFGEALMEYGALFDYETLEGSKNANYPLRLVDGMAIVRQRLPLADGDPAMFREDEIAGLLSPSHFRSVKLLGLPVPRLAIYDFIDGTDLGVDFPIGSALPAHVIDDDVEYQAALCAIPEDAVARLTGGDLRPRSVGAYYAWFDAEITALLAQGRLFFEELYRDLRVPPDPWIRRDGGDWQPRSERRLGLVHGDLHRFNRRIKDGKTFYLDPELAVWADPLRDVTHNIHLTKHDEDERARYLDGWEATLPVEHTRGWRDDYEISMGRSHIASAVLDPPRWARRWLLADDSEKPALAQQLADTLNSAYKYWEPEFRITTGEVSAALDRSVTSPKSWLFR